MRHLGIIAMEGDMANSKINEYVRSDGRYVAEYTCPKTHRTRSISSGDKRRYTARLDDLKLRLHLGKYTLSFSSSERGSVDEYIPRWIAHLETRAHDGHIKMTTIDDYRSHVRNYLLPAFTDVQIRTFHKSHIQNLIDGVKAERSPKTVANISGTISSFCKWLVDQEILLHDPSAGVVLPVQEDVDTWIPTAEMMRRLMDNLESNTPMGLRGQIMITVAATTGMRIGEIRALSWDCVDLDRGEIRINKDADRHQTIGKPKTRQARRIVPINSALVHLLKKWRLDCPRSPFIPISNHLHSSVVEPMRKAGLVFATANGTVIGNQECWENILKPALVRADLESVWQRRWHTLRHWAASRMIEIGKSPKYVQTKLGHKDIKTTFNRYGHIIDRADDRDTADLMSQF